MKKEKKWVLFSLLLVLFSITIFNGNKVTSSEVRSVETQGSIGFTGVYEPIGKPDPTPPESIEKPPIKDIAKPDGSLPQTNAVFNSTLVWLGISLLLLAFILWKQKQEKKQN